MDTGRYGGYREIRGIQGDIRRYGDTGEYGGYKGYWGDRDCRGIGGRLGIQGDMDDRLSFYIPKYYEYNYDVRTYCILTLRTYSIYIQYNIYVS